MGSCIPPDVSERTFPRIFPAPYQDWGRLERKELIKFAEGNLKFQKKRKSVKVEFYIGVKDSHELCFYTKYTGGQTPPICSTLECVFIEYTEWACIRQCGVYTVGMYTLYRQWHVYCRQSWKSDFASMDPGSRGSLVPIFWHDADMPMMRAFLFG